MSRGRERALGHRSADAALSGVWTRLRLCVGDTTPLTRAPRLTPVARLVDALYPRRQAEGAARKPEARCDRAQTSSSPSRAPHRTPGWYSPGVKVMRGEADTLLPTGRPGPDRDAARGPGSGKDVSRTPVGAHPSAGRFPACLRLFLAVTVVPPTLGRREALLQRSPELSRKRKSDPDGPGGNSFVLGNVRTVSTAFCLASRAQES